MKSFSDYIIDIHALRYNIKYFKKLCNNKKICAVVKANGYGHGIKNFVKEIDDVVNSYAVACFYEAIELRELTQKDILILNFVDKKNLYLCTKNNISISVYNKQQLREIDKAKLCDKLKIHFAINTGMNRIGFSNQKDFLGALNKSKKLSNKILVAGVYTHIYNFKSKLDTKKQVAIFKKYAKISKQYFSNLFVHAMASMPSLLYDDSLFDMCRLGIAMYGYGEKNYENSFKPVLSIKSKIICIQKIKKGETVGYGKQFVAKKDMTVAIIPLGYADGIMRCYSNKGRVIVKNKYCKIVGNICMDMFMCDISNLNANLYDEVIILGKNSAGLHIFADEMAKKCNTISYEILTNIKQNRFNIIKKGNLKLK